MNESQIKEANSDDAELIAVLSRKTFVDTFAAANTPENMEKFLREQFSMEQLRNEVGLPEFIFWVAYVNGHAAGYVKLIRSVTPPENINGPAAEIARIYIDKALQGMAIGKQLMQTCINWAKTNAVGDLILGVWEHNAKAIRFYEKWGFIKCGEKDFVLGDDVQHDWIMAKKILSDTAP